MRDFRQAGNRRERTYSAINGREAARSDRRGAVDSSLNEPTGRPAPAQSGLRPRFSVCRVILRKTTAIAINGWAASVGQNTLSFK